MKKERGLEVVMLKRSLGFSDVNLVQRQLGYSSSSIYDNNLKYCHQNYSTKKPKNI